MTSPTVTEALNNVRSLTSKYCVFVRVLLDGGLSLPIPDSRNSHLISEMTQIKLLILESNYNKQEPKEHSKASIVERFFF